NKIIAFTLKMGARHACSREISVSVSGDIEIAVDALFPTSPHFIVCKLECPTGPSFITGNILFILSYYSYASDHNHKSEILLKITIRELHDGTYLKIPSPNIGIFSLENSIVLMEQFLTFHLQLCQEACPLIRNMCYHIGQHDPNNGTGNYQECERVKCIGIGLFTARVRHTERKICDSDSNFSPEFKYDIVYGESVDFVQPYVRICTRLRGLIRIYLLSP
ncbi:hypothetical protein L9F63_002234, partial [Diploptera punctata]